MSPIHLVRIGAFGQVGRFRSTESRRFARDTSVICRTERGLEIGKVLSYDSASDSDLADGDLIRGMTAEDNLLTARLERHKQRAIRACERLLRDRDLGATLLDAELLFDGKSLFFYFMGDVDERVERLTSELASTYEAKARIGDFANLLSKGCGPACGTEAGSGCSTGGCAGCANASSCKT